MADAWGGSWGFFWGVSWGVSQTGTSPSTGGGGFAPHRRVPPDEHQRELEHQARRQSRKIERDDADTRLLQEAWNKAFGIEPGAGMPIGSDLSPQQLSALAQRLWEQEQLLAEEELAIVMLLAL